MPGTSGAGGQAGGDRQGCQALPTPEGSNGDLTAHRCPGEWAFSSLRGKSSQSSDFPKSEVSASQIGKTQGQTGRSKPCPASRGQSLLPRLSEMTHGHIVQQTEAPRRWRQRPLSATAPGPAEPVGSPVSPQELWGLGPDFLSNYNCLF